MTTYNIYRREVGDTNQPVAIATGLTSKEYSDFTGIKGKYYLYSVGAVKNEIEKVSDEVEILAGVAWTPQHLVNLPSFWVDSENVIKDSSNRVSQLTDISGNNMNFTQSSNTQKPTLVDGVIRFDGVDDFLPSNSSALSVMRAVGSAFVFAVFSKRVLDTSDVDRSIFTVSTNANLSRLAIFAGLGGENRRNKICFIVRQADTGSSVIIDSGFDMQADTDYIVFGEVDYINRRASLFVNGVEIETKTGVFSGSAQSANTNSSNIRIGANNVITPAAFAQSDISCIILRNSKLALTDDRQKLEGWAAHKYGLTDNLPLDHPYKTLTPYL